MMRFRSIPCSTSNQEGPLQHLQAAVWQVPQGWLLTPPAATCRASEPAHQSSRLKTHSRAGPGDWSCANRAHYHLKLTHMRCHIAPRLQC